MKHIVTSFLFFAFSTSFSQKIKPINIYLQFGKGSDCSKILKFYRQEEKGVVFNLYCNDINSFLYQTGSDTLPIVKLKDYKFSTNDEIELLEKQWWKKNRQILKKKFGENCCPPYDKNYIFQTNLIEIIDEQRFVIYPVEWRNLNIISDGEDPPKRE